MFRKSIVCTAIVILLAATAAQAAMPEDFTSLAKNAGPAVVNINTEKVVQQQARNPFPFPSPFEDFFRGMPGMPPDAFDRFNNQAPRERTKRSLGSGFIISADGYIVTNHHVVAGADSIRVSFDGNRNSEKSYKAELIGSDKDTDLAILKIDAKNLPFLKLGDSEAVQVGEWVMAIGNPFGLDHTVTAGIISAKGRNIQSGPFDSFLQTDASINPGNSGGPLLNMKGEVIGINAAIIANGQGIGFAIPSNLAKEVVEGLKTNRKMSRGWIGVTIQNLDANGAKALGLDKPEGALIGDVLPNNPAAKAGLKAGDVILSVNGETVKTSNELLRKIAAVKPGGKASVVVWRNGGKRSFTITVAERPTDSADAGRKPSSTEKDTPLKEILGIAVRPVTREDLPRVRLDKPQGLLVSGIMRGRKASQAGIRTGDVIFAANGTELESEDELVKILQTEGKSRGAVMLHVLREGKGFFRAIELSDK